MPGPAGNRLTAAENLYSSSLNTHPSTINRLYTYDTLYRLTGESITNGAQISALGYVYDPVGNRTNRFGSGSVTNLLPAATNTCDANDWLGTDTYDSNGNTKVGQASSPVSGALNCGYDFENRLTHVTNGIAATIEIGYDGDGNRVRKTVTTSTSTNTTYYLVDELNPTGYAQVLEELAPTNSLASGLAVARAYTYGHTLVSQALLDSASHLQTSTSYYGYDGHNNARYLTDGSGVVTDTYDYDAFGGLIAQSYIGTLPTPNSHQFTGEQFDSDLGLYYLRARYGNSDTGRFWTQDKAEGLGEDPQSLHKYLYAQSDPVNRADPTGNYSLTELSTSLTLGLQARILFAGLSGVLGGVINTLDTAIASHFNASAGDLGLAFAAGYRTGFAFGLVATVFPGTTAVIGAALGGYAVGQAINQGNPWLVIFRTLTLGAGIYGARELTAALEDSLPSNRNILDVQVDPTPPAVLPLNRPIGGSPTQDAALQAEIAQVIAQGARDIRVNQEQVNAQGVRVGINRPDLQYTLNGRRYYVEYDTSSSMRGPIHRNRILSNDPKSLIILRTVD